MNKCDTVVRRLNTINRTLWKTELVINVKEMAKNFKLNLEIKRKDTNDYVTHKIDGQRFGHTNTVKLNVNTGYNIKVTLRPAVILR